MEELLFDLASLMPTAIVIAVLALIFLAMKQVEKR